MVNSASKGLGEIIKQQRNSMSLSLSKLAIMSGISQSHLYKIERGKRFPSAIILRKIAKTLGFQENELFMLAGYLSLVTPTEIESIKRSPYMKGLDPYVARVLAEEPIEVQRAVITILRILRSLSKTVGEE